MKDVWPLVAYTYINHEYSRKFFLKFFTLTGLMLLENVAVKETINPVDRHKLTLFVKSFPS